MNEEYLKRVLETYLNLRTIIDSTRKQYLGMKKMKGTYLKTGINYDLELEYEIAYLKKQLDHLKKRKELLNLLQNRLSAIAQVKQEHKANSKKELSVANGDQLYVLSMVGRSKEEPERYAFCKMIGGRIPLKGNVPHECLDITQQEEIEKDEFEQQWQVVESHWDEYLKIQQIFESSEENKKSNQKIVIPEPNLLECPKLVVCFDFDSTNANELSIKSNEKVTLLQIVKGGWSLISNEKKEIGFVPSSFLTQYIPEDEDEGEDEDEQINEEENVAQNENENENVNVNVNVDENENENENENVNVNEEKVEKEEKFTEHQENIKSQKETEKESENQTEKEKEKEIEIEKEKNYEQLQKYKIPQNDQTKEEKKEVKNEKDFEWYLKANTKLRRHVERLNKNLIEIKEENEKLKKIAKSKKNKK
ncbi:sorting nexin [Anaeramoeba flamelloides]|uniref:Sorting nexin n=1 Tax=Anaeramoeba flamelloides TaxID=1746091 RepID=A0ABQ8Z876_9EUKA|nr:sorting nexin [Anaeramoeba flamelloides]